MGRDRAVDLAALQHGFHLGVAVFSVDDDGLATLVCREFHGVDEVLRVKLVACRRDADDGHLHGRSSRLLFVLFRIGLDEERDAVEQVGHAAEEQRSLADDHGILRLAGHDALSGVAQIRHARGDMTLRGRVALQTVFLDEGRKLRALHLAQFDAKGADHLVVRLGHVPCPCGLRDVRILHLGGVLVHVEDGHTGFRQRIGHEGPDDRLRRGSGSDSVSADDVRIDLRALAVVLGNEDREAAEAVFQDGKALLDVVLAVHAELGRAAAAGDDDVLERPRLHEGSRFHDGVRGTRAEASRIAARGVH